MILFTKKALLDDLVDLLVTVIIGFFLFFFLNGTLTIGVQQSNAQTLSALTEFKRQDAAINNLNLRMQEGTLTDPLIIEALIDRSKSLGGKTITGCADYETAEDCQRDTIGIYVGTTNYCVWDETDKECDSLALGGAGP